MLIFAVKILVSRAVLSLKAPGVLEFTAEILKVLLAVSAVVVTYSLASVMVTPAGILRLRNRNRPS
ncbi:hypothetical protein D9M70_509270 [compost metagenome]